jgi:hypothetical protein
LGTSDGSGGDGEGSASVKSMKQLINNSSYCRIKERMFFEKNSEMLIFLKIHPWEPSCSMGANRQTIGRTDGHDGAYSPFSKCSEHVQKLRNCTTSCQPLLCVRQAVFLSNNILFFICEQCHTIQC